MSSRGISMQKPSDWGYYTEDSQLPGTLSSMSTVVGSEPSEVARRC